MTRINLLKVKELSDQHLLAEHREIKRIPNCILKGKFVLYDIPKTFCLGKGHVKFFYDKLAFLRNRYIDLYRECLRRGFNVTDYQDVFWKATETYPSMCNDWRPSKADIVLSQQRINEKLNMKPSYYRWSTDNVCYTNKNKNENR